MKQPFPWKKHLQTTAAILFWIAVWQVVSMRIGKEVLLASPLRVCETLYSLIRQPDFWQTILFSFGRIAGGFLLATLAGILLAVLASRFSFIRSLLSIPIHLIKAVPVASFIILVLLWAGSRALSVIISFLMVLPVIYTNTLQGILQTDAKMLEMARVFHFRKPDVIRMIYLPAVLPYFSGACSVGMGLAFKSGIAAEVIGLPTGSIGEKLYQAKIILSTGEVLAWTAVIVLLSLLFERMVNELLRLLQRRIIG